MIAWPLYHLEGYSDILKSNSLNIYYNLYFSRLCDTIAFEISA
jgi:hypothetical protein